ncbi:MAG: hypothetical protein IKC71_02350 [Clostridia bacterium]|nr:hypothetical protein [Clostridia bacterium]
MDSRLIILLIITGALLIASLTYFLVKYYKKVNADEIKVELDEEIVQLKIETDEKEVEVQENDNN